MFTCEICKSRNFLVLLNCFQSWRLRLNLQKQKFSCVTQPPRKDDRISISAKAEIFLCYSTHSPGHLTLRICKSRNFLVLLNLIISIIVSMDLQKQKFSCVTQPYSHTLPRYESAKAEIFLCYSTLKPLEMVLPSAKAEIFLCYSTMPCSKLQGNICKSRNFLVLLSTYSVIMHKYSLSNTHINHIFCEFFTTLSSNTS